MLPQVYRVLPQTMLPVLPKLVSELQLDQESKRLAALHLLGRLLSSPGFDIDTSYAELFTEFLRRACDEKVGRRDGGGSISVCLGVGRPLTAII
jgi:hypothetical protein